MSLGEDKAFHDHTQRRAVAPSEYFSQMIKMVGHKRIERMISFKNIYTISHEVVDKLAQYDLLSHSFLHLFT